MSLEPQSPVVSVIIPVFNRTELLPLTIDSVIRQRFVNWEVLVVDDGSTEDVAMAIAPFRDSPIKLLEQNNQGNAAARNLGLQHARGEYLVCLDSDDVWDEEMLESCVTVLQNNPEIDVVYTQVKSIDIDGNELPRPIWPEPRDGDLLEPLLMGHSILPSSAVFRRRCPEKWGAYTPGLDDWELWLRWAVNGCRFVCIERPLLHYRLHEQNFGLNWSERRKVHFATLDQFYSREEIPVRAIELQDQAYANQHSTFAILAWRIGLEIEARQEFAKAMEGNEPYLTDIDIYTQLACTHQWRVGGRNEFELELGKAEQTVIDALEAAFEPGRSAGLPTSMKHRAYAWAYYALARLAYSVPHDDSATRRFLMKSVVKWPFIIFHSGLWLWFGRLSLGYRNVQLVRGLLMGSR